MRRDKKIRGRQRGIHFLVSSGPEGWMEFGEVLLTMVRGLDTLFTSDLSPTRVC